MAKQHTPRFLLTIILAFSLAWPSRLPVAAAEAEAATTNPPGTSASATGRSATAPSAIDDLLPRMLVVPADGDNQQSVVLIEHILDVVMDRLHSGGMAAWNVAWVLPEWDDRQPTAWSPRRLAALGRSAKTPTVDVVLLVKPEVRQRWQGARPSVEIRLHGRLVDVVSGRAIDRFQLRPDRPWDVSGPCHQPCLEELLLEQGTFLGSALADGVIERFKPGTHQAKWTWGRPTVSSSFSGRRPGTRHDFGWGRRPWQDYRLVFDGFLPEDLFKITAEIEALDGLEILEVLEAVESRIRHDVYRYRGSINGLALRQVIRDVLRDLNLPGWVSLHRGTLTIRRLRPSHRGPFGGAVDLDRLDSGGAHWETLGPKLRSNRGPSRARGLDDW